MITYFDTSALAKRYILETGSSEVQQLLEESEYVETSALTELEITALLERAKKGTFIDSPTYRKVFHHLQKDIHDNVFSLLNIQKEVWKTAKRMIQQRHLRVADAIQLASALDTNKRFSENIRFICSDHHLLQAAKLEGLQCIDPTKNF